MRVDILGVFIDPFTMQETVAKIREAVRKRTPLRVITANPELIYAAGQDMRLKNLINTADIVTADGIGVVWAARRLGTPVPERVTGIDLLETLFPLAGAGNWRVFFLGGKPGVAELAAQKISARCPGIVWQAAHGYFRPEEEKVLIKQIKEFQPDLLLVGLGAPKQEFWIANHPGLGTVSIGVGGSFDALAGINKRAPRWVRNIHLEWFYRLLKQPSRLPRQLVLPRFAWKVMQQRPTQK